MKNKKHIIINVILVIVALSLLVFSKLTNFKNNNIIMTIVFALIAIQQLVNAYFFRIEKKSGSKASLICAVIFFIITLKAYITFFC